MYDISHIRPGQPSSGPMSGRGRNLSISTIGFGLLTCQRPPGDSRTWTELYRQAISLARVAEEEGFDSVWMAEHHFADDGYLPASLVLAGAIAASTSSIRIGTSVLLAALHHPVRLAEDAAVASLVSNGRLILGLGGGYLPTEFEGMGLDFRERGYRMDRAIKVLADTRTGRRCIPLPDGTETGIRPFPDGPLPIWVGGSSSAALARAAKYADGFISNAEEADFLVQCATIRELRLKPTLAARPFDIAYFARLFYPAADIGSGWRAVGRYARYMEGKYADLEASARRDEVANPPPMSVSDLSQLRAASWIGAADSLVARLDRLSRAASEPFHLILGAYYPGMPFEHQMTLTRRIGSMLPQLRGVGV